MKRTPWMSLLMAGLLALPGFFALPGCSGDDDDDSSGDDDASQGDDDDMTQGDDDDTTANTDFVFDESPVSAYTRVDRMGMPAIATAVITSKDAYNADDPEDDATGKWATEITTNLTGIHAALDDDLAGLDLTPCAVEACVGQAAPLVIPDTLKIDPTMPAGFPNGRLLTDPVIDVTLAVVLLDLSSTTGCGGGPCTVTFFAELPLNPSENDLAFSSSFPFLAEPHQP